MTTQATLRSRRTKAESVYHVQITGDRDTPTSPLVKIQGCKASAAAVCQTWLVEHAFPNTPTSLVAPGFPPAKSP